LQPTINKEHHLTDYFQEERKRGVLMKKLAALLPAVLFVLFASAAYSQSLADLANKEKERREEITNARVITPEEARKFITESETPAPSADQQSGKSDSEQKGSGAETHAQSEKTDSDEPVDFEGRPESYWRKTMADARQKVKDLENEANVLILKQNSLQNEFYREDDGFKREGIQREIQKTYYEQDQNKENLEKAKAALQDLENEARKSGALPGWISAKNP
jgi:hypothetical protein